MAVNLSFLKRLIKEDFASKDQELVGKIGSILNPALEQITGLFNKGLGVDDLNMQSKDITFTTDASGQPNSSQSFKTTLRSKCRAIMIGRVQNLTNTASYPTVMPIVSFEEDQGQLIINHISGLNGNTKYQILLIAIA